MRITHQCQNCACYYSNWTEEVEKTMDEQAPGEECSTGMNPYTDFDCPCWIETEK